MKTLKFLVAPIALAASALSMTATLHAQPMHARPAPACSLTHARNAAIRQEINQLGNQIDRAAARRTISRREATGLRQQARNVQRLYASYQRGGLTRAEVQTLQARVNQVRAALRMERLDWDNRRG